MKKIFLALSFALLLAGIARAEPPAYMTVPTNSVKILPQRDIQNATAWVAGATNAQGVIRTNVGRFYMAVTNGINGATGPTHFYGDGTDGALTWRKVGTGRRNGYTIVNDSAVTIYTSKGYPAERGKGTRLNSGGGSESDAGADVYQGSFSAIAVSGTTNNLTLLEW